MNKTVIYGNHASMAVLKHHASNVLEVWCSKSRRQDLEKLIHASKVKTVSNTVLDEEVSGENHQGVVVFCRPVEAKQEAFLKKIVTEKKDAPVFLLVLPHLN